MRSIDSPQPTLEIYRERAYSFTEVGRWLLDFGSVISRRARRSEVEIGERVSGSNHCRRAKSWFERQEP